jgi:hypothetical protein
MVVAGVTSAHGNSFLFTSPISEEGAMKTSHYFAACIVVLALLLPAGVQAQTLPCTRVDANDMLARVDAWGTDAQGQNVGSNNTDFDPVLAHCDNAVVLSPTAHVQGSTTAACVTPQGGSASVPQVTTALSGQAQSDGLLVRLGAPGFPARADAPTTFQVQPNGGVTTGTLRGSIYLTGSANGPNITTTAVNAACGGSWVTAVFVGNGWWVSGVLQTANGPVWVMQWLPNPLNALYTCQERTQAGNQHALTAFCTSDPIAGGNWGPLSLRELSASAWFEVSNP